MTTPRRLRALCLVMTLAALSALTPGQVDLKDAPARATAELKVRTAASRHIPVNPLEHEKTVTFYLGLHLGDT